jgi:hypothetical protein
MNLRSLALSVVKPEDERSEFFELILELVHRLHVVEHGRRLEGALVVGQAHDPWNVLEVALLHQVDRFGRKERHRRLGIDPGGARSNLSLKNQLVSKNIEK